jgi:GNAT superfamily N-acetyltransferase
VQDQEERARQRLDAVEAGAKASDLVVPIGASHEERQLWRACDLALLVEGCFQELLDPTTLHAEAQRPWLERLKGTFQLPSVDSWEKRQLAEERRYWIGDSDRRLGIVKLGVSPFRGPWLWVHSLYLLPEHRGRGIASRLLERLAQDAARHELAGARLATSWTWQKSLRFYLARGFWIWGWKHDIQLVTEPSLPVRRFAIDGDMASFDVRVHGELRRLWTAHRDGDRLTLEEGAQGDDLDVELRHLGIGTFAMLLALAGFPLVRSESHWARRYHSSDAGQPEGLAYKIGVFERVAREHGWSVDTVGIPGLELWQAWARGEEHGVLEQLLRDVEAVVHARGWTLEPERRDRLRTLDPYFGLEELLRTAATAETFAEWWDVAEKQLGKSRS